MGRVDRTDWERVDAMTDADIARAVATDPDAAPLDAKRLMPTRRGRPRKANPKRTVSIRLAPEIIDFFKAATPDGRGWQTRLHRALEEYVREHQA